MLRPMSVRPVRLGLPNRIGMRQERPASMLRKGSIRCIPPSDMSQQGIPQSHQIVPGPRAVRTTPVAPNADRGARHGHHGCGRGKRRRRAAHQHTVLRPAQQEAGLGHPRKLCRRPQSPRSASGDLRFIPIGAKRRLRRIARPRDRAARFVLALRIAQPPHVTAIAVPIVAGALLLLLREAGRRGGCEATIIRLGCAVLAASFVIRIVQLQLGMSSLAPTSVSYQIESLLKDDRARGMDVGCSWPRVGYRVRSSRLSRDRDSACRGVQPFPRTTDRPYFRAMTTITPVPFLDLAPSHSVIAADALDDIRALLGSGMFTNGPAVRAFEAAYADYCGVPYCVGVANGLDALRLALIGIGLEPGDEVIVPAMTFIATFEAVTQAGGIPVPVDIHPEPTIDPDAVRSAITGKTRALMPVHLYGRMVDMVALNQVADGLAVIEDACQSHGATRDGIRPGTGIGAAFSFYPGKNLGAIGDAGAFVTRDPDLAELADDRASGAWSAAEVRARHGGLDIPSRHDPGGVPTQEAATSRHVERSATVCR